MEVGEEWDEAEYEDDDGDDEESWEDEGLDDYPHFEGFSLEPSERCVTRALCSA
jgi:hypothetical protein